MVGSVSSKTDFLLSNESSDSSKFVQAVSLGVPVLTEKQLNDEYFQSAIQTENL